MEKVKSLIQHFDYIGEFKNIAPMGNGHINDTYLLTFQDIDKTIHRYTLQRINHKVFTQPYKLMENIENVTSHIFNKILENGGDAKREVLNIIKTKDNLNCFEDEDGNFWRSYYFIDGVKCYTSVENPEHFYKSAKAFGKFQNQLADFPAKILFEIIPEFHNTNKRFEALLEAISQDKCGRAKEVSEEIKFALNRQADAGIIVELLKTKQIPLKVTHNDTKLNNVLIDDITDEGICVIDLDTVMPGSALYDFGDSIRFGATTAAEDETDLTKVNFNLDLFEIYSKGYLEEAYQSLNPTEIKYLPIGAKIITFECGIRFLTDYLNGDTYFKTSHKQQNLDRARNQFKLVYDMEKLMDEMNLIIENCLSVIKN